MSCDELRDHYELYALGLAEEPAGATLGEHLRAECPRCTPGVARARALNFGIAGWATLVDPPPGLRKRVLAVVGAEQRGFGWTPWLAFATALSLTFGGYFFGRARESAFEMARARAALRTQSIELTRMKAAMAILSGAETRAVGFGGEKATAPPRGRVFVNRERGVLLMASNLEPLGEGKTYQMWIIPKGGKPLPAGLFSAAGDNTAMHVLRGPVDPNVAAVAVTVEDSGGASQPTTTPIIVAALETGF